MTIATAAADLAAWFDAGVFGTPATYTQGGVSTAILAIQDAADRKTHV